MAERDDIVFLHFCWLHGEMIQRRDGVLARKQQEGKKEGRRRT